jgi:hypothetical protein
MRGAQSIIGKGPTTTKIGPDFWGFSRMRDFGGFAAIGWSSRVATIANPGAGDVEDPGWFRGIQGFG